jgi:hypothetical protein
LLPDTFVQNVAHRVYLGHAMEASQITGKGVWSRKNMRSEPQSDWNSFMPAETIPKNV